MRRYRKDESLDDLEHWPFDNKASDYVIAVSYTHLTLPTILLV